MKKLLSVLLFAVITAGLIACSSKNETHTLVPTEKNESEVIEEEVEGTESSEIVEEEEEVDDSESSVPEYNLENAIMYNGEYGELKLTEVKDNAFVFEFDNATDNEYSFYDISVSANNQIYVYDDFEGELSLVETIAAGVKTKFYLYFPVGEINELTNVSAKILVCDDAGYHLDILATDELNLLTGEVTPADDIIDEASTYDSIWTTEKKLLASTKYGDIYLCGMTDSEFILQFDNKTDEDYCLYGEGMSLNGKLYIGDDFQNEEDYLPFGVIAENIGSGSSKVLFYFPNLGEETVEKVSFTFLFCKFAFGDNLETIVTDEVTLN